MSWEKVHDWYDQLVGDQGHEYHRTLIWPELKKFLLKKGDLLDLACGQGAFQSQLPKELLYTGIDLSPSLIAIAKKKSTGSFYVKDVEQPLDLNKKFDQITCILALQNFKNWSAFFKNCKEHLKDKGQCIVVINHPCFRIPRQSRWVDDMTKKLRSRQVDRYMTALDIPIQVHPGKQHSETLTHYHAPLSKLFAEATAQGLAATHLAEWCSPKKSEGARQKMENRSREEFPLFLCIIFTPIS